jgi:hypothetical protein
MGLVDLETVTVPDNWLLAIAEIRARYAVPPAL